MHPERHRRLRFGCGAVDAPKTQGLRPSFVPQYAMADSVDIAHGFPQPRTK